MFEPLDDTTRRRVEDALIRIEGMRPALDQIRDPGTWTDAVHNACHATAYLKCVLDDDDAARHALDAWADANAPEPDPDPEVWTQAEAFEDAMRN